VLEGHLPKQSLFFKSIIYNRTKKSLRRRMFRLRKGKAVPGIMGLLMVALYGKVPEGYFDFGLASDETEDSPPASDTN
jgi:hypothetical protein